VTLLYRPTIN